MHPCAGPEHPKQEHERSTAFIEQPSSDLHDASPVFYCAEGHRAVLLGTISYM
jgi:hypothetical protein